MVGRFTVLVTLVGLLTFGLAGAASAQEVTLNANLTGEQQVSGGEAGGTGSAIIRIDPISSEICFDIRLDISEEPTAAHIHLGGPGVDGPVIVNLDWDDTRGDGCVTPRSRTAGAQILLVPSGYYVNVHTPSHGGGAVRGQLFELDRGDQQLAFTDSNLTLILAITGATLVAGGALVVASTRRES